MTEDNNKYLTKEDASKLYCPFPDYKICNGVECMAWKWTKWKTVIKKKASPPERPYPTTRQIPTHGTCALIYSDKTIHNLKEISV